MIAGILLLGPGCFAADAENGFIEHITLSTASLEGYILSKFITLSLITLVPAMAIIPALESQNVSVAGLYSALPLAGIAMIALSGAGYILFAGAPGPLPEFELLPPRTAHGLAAWTLIALIAAHVGAALYHQLVRGDRLLGRMGLGPAA